MRHTLYILLVLLILGSSVSQAQTCSVTTTTDTIANSPTPSYVTQILFFNSRLYYVEGDEAGYIRYVDYPTIPVSGSVTLVGNGASTFATGSPGTSAAIPFAHMLVLSADSSTLYSSCANRYVMFTAAVSDGTVARLVGTGSVGSGDSATGTSATMSNTYGMLLDPTDTTLLYFSDLVYHVIRRVTLTGTNPVTTIIGASGSSTFQAGFGTSARIDNPAGMSRYNNEVIYVASVSGYIISWTLATTYVTRLNTPTTQAAGELTVVGSSRAFADGLWFSFLSTAFAFGPDNYLYISDLGGSNLKVFAADPVNGQLYYTHDNGALMGRALATDPDDRLIISYDSSGFRVLTPTKSVSCPVLVTRTITEGLSATNENYTKTKELTLTDEDSTSSSGSSFSYPSSQESQSSSLQSSSAASSSVMNASSSSSSAVRMMQSGSSSSSSSTVDDSDRGVSTRRGTIDIDDCSKDNVWWIVLLIVVLLVLLIVILCCLCCPGDDENREVRSVKAMDVTDEEDTYATLTFTSRRDNVGSAHCFGAPYDGEPAPLRRVSSAHCFLSEEQDPPIQCLPTRTFAVREESVNVPMEFVATPSEAEPVSGFVAHYEPPLHPHPSSSKEGIIGRCFFCRRLVSRTAYVMYEGHGPAHPTCCHDIDSDPRYGETLRDRDPSEPYLVVPTSETPDEGSPATFLPCLKCLRPVFQSEQHYAVRRQGVVHQACLDSYADSPSFPIEPMFPEAVVITEDNDGIPPPMQRCLLCQHFVVNKPFHIYPDHGVAHPQCSMNIYYDPVNDSDSLATRDASEPYKVPALLSQSEESPQDYDVGICIQSRRRIMASEQHFALRGKGIIRAECLDEYLNNPFAQAYPPSESELILPLEPAEDEDYYTGSCFFCTQLIAKTELHFRYSDGLCHQRCIPDVSNDPESKSSGESISTIRKPYCSPATTQYLVPEGADATGACIHCFDTIVSSEDHYAVRFEGLLHEDCLDEFNLNRKEYPKPYPVAGSIVGEGHADSVGRCFFCRYNVEISESYWVYPDVGVAHSACQLSIHYDTVYDADTGDPRDANEPYFVPAVEDPDGEEGPSAEPDAGICIQCRRVVVKEEEHFAVRGKGVLHDCCVEHYKDDPFEHYYPPEDAEPVAAILDEKPPSNKLKSKRRQPTDDEPVYAGQCFFCAHMILASEDHFEFQVHGKCHKYCFIDVTNDPKYDGQGQPRSRTGLYRSPAQTSKAFVSTDPTDTISAPKVGNCIQCLGSVLVTEEHSCLRNIGPLHQRCEQDWLEEDGRVSSYKSSSYNYESDPAQPTHIDLQVIHGSSQDEPFPATPYGNDDDAVSVTSSQANSPYGRRSSEEKAASEDPRSPELDERLSDATSVHSSLDGETEVSMLDLNVTKVFPTEQEPSPETARLRMFDDEELSEGIGSEDERSPRIDDRLSDATVVNEDDDELPAVITSKEPAPMPFPSPESARTRAFDDEEVLESALSETGRCSDIIDTLSRAEVTLDEDSSHDSGPEGVTTTPREPIHTDELPIRDRTLDDEEMKLPILIPSQPKVDLQLVPQTFSLVPRVSEGAIIELRNTSEEFRVMYSVRSTHSKRYTVRPRHGVIPPSEVEYVSIQLQRHQQQPLPTSGEDKFQVLFRGLWTEEQCPTQRPEITDCLKHAVFEVESVEYSINTSTEKKQLNCTIQDVRLHNPESETPLMHLL